MSRATDKALAESMGKRRPKEVIQAEVQDSVLSEMVPPTTIDVPVTSLLRSPFQVRTMGGEDEVARLAESIQQSGLISPVVVRPVSKPNMDLRCKAVSSSAGSEEDLTVKFYEIVSGHHRVMALQKLGWDSVPVIVKHMTDAQAAVALTADNAIKKDLSDWDRYLSILMLEQTGACRTGREIAATLGISPSQVTNLRAFGHLPEEAQAIVRETPVVCAYKLAYKLHSKGLNETEPILVTEALQRLADRLNKDSLSKDSLEKDELTAQEQVVPWILSRVAARNSVQKYRRELRIHRPGEKAIKVVVTETGATIEAPGLNPDKLAALLESNLAALVGIAAV